MGGEAGSVRFLPLDMGGEAGSVRFLPSDPVKDLGVEDLMMGSLSSNLQFFLF
jgi:hypothetical protein